MNEISFFPDQVIMATTNTVQMNPTINDWISQVCTTATAQQETIKVINIINAIIPVSTFQDLASNASSISTASNGSAEAVEIINFIGSVILAIFEYIAQIDADVTGLSSTDVTYLESNPGTVITAILLIILSYAPTTINVSVFLQIIPFVSSIGGLTLKFAESTSIWSKLFCCCAHAVTPVTTASTAAVPPTTPAETTTTAPTNSIPESTPINS